jgi:PAS domain S-box-containing protein
LPQARYRLTDNWGIFVSADFGGSESQALAGLDFRAAFYGAPTPLLVMRADPPRYSMIAVNTAHARAFGVTSAALEGRGVLEVFPPDPSPEVAEFMAAVRASLDQVMASGKPHQMAVRPYAIPGRDGNLQERFWSAVNSPLLDAGGRISHIVSAAQDVTGEVQERRSEEARRLLMREVDHRARNALTVVQSFVRLTTAANLEQFRDILAGRIEALARAQTSLAARRWEGADLHDVIAQELGAMSATGRHELSGPRITLRPEHVQPMSMAVHELATNAAKYGALSTAEGEVRVTWSREPDGALSLCWQEKGGPPVAPPSKEGFGSRLVGELARHSGGQLRRMWRPAGLVVELRLPLGDQAG